MIVLDTNVLVSALLSPHGNPAQVLDLILVGEERLVVHDQLLAEYREVLARPRFRFDSEDVAALLAFIEQEAEHVAPKPLGSDLPDPDDAIFLAVAAAADATLVTGNLRHYPREQRAGVYVVSPADYLAERTTSSD